jgi:hypothetical protein
VTNGPTLYDNTQPQITNASAIPYTSLSSLTETLGSVNGCSGGVQYILSPDGTNWYYYAAGNWSPSAAGVGSFTDSNPASTLTSQALGAFANQVGTGQLYFRAFLNSNGTSPCEIHDLSISGFH